MFVQKKEMGQKPKAASKAPELLSKAGKTEK
jgi:hypothetical protein